MMCMFMYLAVVFTVLERQCGSVDREIRMLGIGLGRRGTVVHSLRRVVGVIPFGKHFFLAARCLCGRLKRCVRGGVSVSSVRVGGAVRGENVKGGESSFIQLGVENIISRGVDAFRLLITNSAVIGFRSVGVRTFRHINKGRGGLYTEVTSGKRSSLLGRIIISCNGMGDPNDVISLVVR